MKPSGSPASMVSAAKKIGAAPIYRNSKGVEVKGTSCSRYGSSAVVA